MMGIMHPSKKSLRKSIVLVFIIKLATCLDGAFQNDSEDIYQPVLTSQDHIGAPRIMIAMQTDLPDEFAFCQLLFPFSSLGDRLHPGAINQKSISDDITGDSMLAQCFQYIGCIQYDQIRARPYF